MSTKLLSLKMAEIAANLNSIRETIAAAVARRPKEYNYFQPRLVAVSKTKPPELLIAAYQAGQRNFGENYVNELVEKANHPDILDKCKDIKWHFIGHLQRNKINKVLAIPNLYLIETIDSEKLATAVANAWSKLRHGDDEKLNIMVQVNTSKEDEKNGCEMEQTPVLVKHILENCKNLTFKGLMTIGAYGYDVTKGPNPDFVALKKCRELVCEALKLAPEDVEISMGMSSDYEHAVNLIILTLQRHTTQIISRPSHWVDPNQSVFKKRLRANHPSKVVQKITEHASNILDDIEAGSTNVRVGTSIFGTRAAKK